MQIHSRHGENQERWVWTEGLQTIGQQEVAVNVSWSEDDPRDILVTYFLQFLERYLNGQAKRILSEQTLRYGWSLLRFVRDEQNKCGIGSDTLLVEEMQSPLTQENPSYVPGIAHTLALLQLQNEALRRNGITGTAVHPSYSQLAIICSRITPETLPVLRPLKAERAWEPNTRESGWFIGCCDQKHEHDNSDELTVVHLLHLVERFPGLFPYLAMPVGTLVVFEESQAIIFRPGEQEGQVDPGDLLSPYCSER